MNIVLFKYSPDTPTEKLLSHHRMARLIIFPCFFSAVTMASQIAQILLFGMTPLSMVILILSTIVSIALIIPALFCASWISEIEDVLKDRNIPVPGGETINRRVQYWAIMMMLWSVCAIFGPSLIKSIMK
jgi:hypothetical protein